MRDHHLFLRGEWRPGFLGEFKKVFNPATERAVARVACATEHDVEEAIAAAADNVGAWGSVPAEARGRVLLRAANILRSKIDSASTMLSEEQGKTIAEARGEFLRAVETLTWNGEHAGTLCEPISVGDGRSLLPAPAGVVAAFVPWNYPAVLTARKLAPSLAAGCPVILKAAEEAPGAAVAVVSALQEAGTPPGVLSLLFGDPPAVSRQLLASPAVRVVTFTGSTRVGRELAGGASTHLQRCILELGGHAAVIVLEDADLESAVHAIADYKFECAGQSCNAPSRVFVHLSMYEPFVQKLAAVAQAIRVGAGNEPDTQMGPMASPRGLASMERLCADAVSRGATVVTGGNRLKRAGYFWAPTILRDVPEEAAIMHEEPFGPVIPVAPFTRTDHAVKMANASCYGLAAYIFSAGNERAEEIAAALSVGSVGINQLRGVAPDVPTGGLNASGYGYEGGIEGFRGFQSLKLINAKRGPSAWQR